MSRPANPLIMSSFDMVLALELAAALPSPKPRPRRSSNVDTGCALAAGEATLWGVPARPSKPDSPDTGCFCKEAGADPSKSMSSRFSMLDCGGAWPLTTAAAAAAAIGFSRAFCCCSLQDVSKIKVWERRKHTR
jgi:hypothetical protein